LVLGPRLIIFFVLWSRQEKVGCWGGKKPKKKKREEESANARMTRPEIPTRTTEKAIQDTKGIRLPNQKKLKTQTKTPGAKKLEIIRNQQVIEKLGWRDQGKRTRREDCTEPFAQVGRYGEKNVTAKTGKKRKHQITQGHGENRRYGTNVLEDGKTFRTFTVLSRSEGLTQVGATRIRSGKKSQRRRNCQTQQENAGFRNPVLVKKRKNTHL